MANPLAPDDLKQRVADALQTTPANLEVRWDGIVADALDSAYRNVSGLLMARGFSQAQVDGWADLPEYLADIGTFWALTRGAGITTLQDVNINKLDRRKELAAIVLFDAGGSPILPAPAVAGVDAVSGGRLAQDETKRIQCLDWWT